MTQGIPIPITIQGNDALVMLARIVNALEGTGRAAEQSAPKADHLSASLRGVGEAARHINEIREVVVTFAQALYHAAERVGVLAGEQQRLDANSARLGLNFQRAAENAGGFVSEMQTMQLATALANRNIRVTQTELDALARVGMARAVDAGKNVEEVFDSIADSVVEGGEELEKFGSELHSVADDAHNATDRLSALVERGRSVPPVMRIASDDVARFEASLRSAGRYISTGFMEETSRLSQLNGNLRGVRTDAEEARREMDSLGRSAAYVLRGLADLGGIVIGYVAMSIRGLTGALQGVAEAVRTRSLSGLRTGTASAADDLRSMQEFIDARIASLMALDRESQQRTSVAPTRAAAPPPDMINTSQMEGRDPRTGRTLRQQTTGGARTEQRRATLEELMGRAFERSGPRARLPGVVGEQTEEQLRASGEREREAIRTQREAEQRKGRESYERGEEGARAFMERERASRREERLLEERRDRYRTFTDEMEQLAGRRINVAREEAEFVTTSFRSMGKAFSDHLTAFVEGKEELGVALQGMLSDTLKAISQEAAVKAGLNLAEGFAALATYRYDAAASHFAAAGIYTGVALASGAVGAAIAPSSSTAAREGAASQERSREAAPMAAGSTTSGGPTVINVAFNGPQFGTGGVVQAARELVGVINQGALQGGVQMNRLAVGAARG